MGQIGIWQIVIIILLAVLLFGRGKISQLMGDVAKGINAFKTGMKEGADEDKKREALEQGGNTAETRATETGHERRS